VQVLVGETVLGGLLTSLTRMSSTGRCDCNRAMWVLLFLLFLFPEAPKPKNGKKAGKVGRERKKRKKRKKKMGSKKLVLQATKYSKSPSVLCLYNGLDLPA